MLRTRRSAVVSALGKRDLRRYFNNPTGYVFITLFILLSAAAAFWRPRFFLNSLANLDQLNQVFPWLLVFFLPALAMGLWSEEKKQGTDELLLTLPATETGIILGKYVAAAGIYSISLAVSISHAIVLAWLGHPDWGLLAANYFGFWAIGVALLPAAMLASVFTSNATIAFVFGALLCAVPVRAGQAGRNLAPLSVVPYFNDFARGVVSLSGLVYFASIASFFLYLNILALQRRHWRKRTAELPMSLHSALRVASLALIAGSLVALAERTHARLDLTAEKLFSLSPQTRSLLDAIPADRPVIVQAFISSDMPEQLVQTRENLLGILREIQARGGAKTTVTVEDTEPYSEQARLARERYNIGPRTLADTSSGEALRDVYLGVAVTSGVDEQVIPFFDPGLSPEYELARAIRVATRARRKRVGILDTDVKILGGEDSQDNRQREPWALVDELRKEYDVVAVTPADAPGAQVDVLLVVQPSRMTQTDLDLAMEPIRRGVATLLLVDPLPMFDLQLAPGADLANQIDPYRPAPTARLVFGDIRAALESVGINWAPALIAWDAYNPHPDMADLPSETVFVGTGNGNPAAFNRANPATAGLEEVLLLYPGFLGPSHIPGFSFEPLLQTGRASGQESFFDLVIPTREGLAIKAAPARETDHRKYTLAARVRSQKPVGTIAGARPVDIVAIADLDFISDNFFQIREFASGASFDNVPFFLNTIDLLAGDDSFMALRSRRGRHRTLERLEAQTRNFADRRAREEQQAEKDARSALEDARSRLANRVADLNARQDLDAVAKRIMVQNLQENENRRLRVLQNKITEAKDAKVHASRETMEVQIRNIRTRIRTLAVLLPPLPVLLIGVWIFVRRARREREGAGALQRLRKAA